MCARLERAGRSRVHRTFMTPGLEFSSFTESKALISTKALRVCAIGQSISARSDQSHGLQLIKLDQQVLPDRNEKTSMRMHFTRKSPWHRPLCDAHIH